MASRLRKTTFKLKNLAFVDVSGRIAHTLMDLCKQPDAMTHPDGMQIKVTRQELGKIAGCSREMAGRVLKSLEEEGLVSGLGQDRGGAERPHSYGSPSGRNNAASAAPGSSARMNASPTRNAPHTPALAHDSCTRPRGV
jgi:hypothetical protein